MQDSRLTQLVTQAQAGCRDSFGELVRQFESTVRAIAMRRLRNESEAAEVTQEVLLQAMRKLPQLQEPERFAGWLKQIAARMSINRAVRRPQEVVAAPETLNVSCDAPPMPLERILQTERAHQVHHGLERLGQIDRETLWAFYFEGQSLKEMSLRFASPVGTIKRRLHTARNRLKAALAE